jgi:hypothetical protein
MNTIKSISKPFSDTEDHLEITVQTLTEFLTGIAVSEKKDWALSIGYLLQRVRGGDFLTQLLSEVHKYREKGKIKDDYMRTPQSLDCLQQVLESVDKDVPDELKFKAMKNLFLNIASETLSSREEILPSQLIKIFRSLSSGELLVLVSSYQVWQKGEWKVRQAKRGSRSNSADTSDWMREMLALTGLQFSELVRINESLLLNKRLLSQSVYDDGSAFECTEFYRLTALGHKLCVFIEEKKLD